MPKKKKIPVKIKGRMGIMSPVNGKNKIAEEPLKGYTQSILKNTGPWMNRLMIGTPTTGLVRIEWVMARFGQIIPTNWSATDNMQPVVGYFPLMFQVPDAQNLIVKNAIEKQCEWLLFIESDNVLPPDAFIRFNEYMRSKKEPVVSGLYFTKSDPPEPMVYRGRGTSFFHKWKMGEKVRVDGLPTGAVLIHMSIIKAMWDESPEYFVNGVLTRRVFEVPEKVWSDPEGGGTYTLTGTSDLTWCERVIREGYLEKAGWLKHAKMEYPFIVDTNIFVKHIDNEGRMFPLEDPCKIGY